MRITLFSAIAVIFLGLINLNKSFAQSANIRGFVYESESAEPVIFTSVILKGTTYGAQTDVNGYFSITKLPAGKLHFNGTMLGHDTLKEDINGKRWRNCN
jgi:hypothetical protein